MERLPMKTMSRFAMVVNYYESVDFYKTKGRIKINVTAEDEVGARRKAIAQAAVNGCCVDQFVSVNRRDLG
jgi:hypothetical protein